MIVIGNIEMPTNANSVYAIKDGNTIILDEVECIKNGEAISVWKRLKTLVLFDTQDNEVEMRLWYRATSANNGWGNAACETEGVVADWNQIDCTGYKKCIVRIRGNIESVPSGATANSTYIKIGFTHNYENAIEVVNKWNNTSGASGQSGLAYGDWYELEIDISQLTGVQSLNVFIGGAYQNGGYLYCSKITLSTE